MSTIWQIEAIPLYRFYAPGPEVLFQRGFGEMVEMVIYAFLLRGDGGTLLVDTGLPADYSALNASVIGRKGLQAGFFPVGRGIAAELATRDASPDLITVTSFGPYAVGGLEQLPRTPLAVSARGIADLQQPEEPALVHPLSDLLRERLLQGQKVSGETVLSPGVTFIETGVHHPASAAVVVDTAEGRVAIADPIFTARNLVEGIALGAAEHAAGWHAMVRMVAGRADAILPIHDPSPVPVPPEAWHHSLPPGPHR